MDTTRTSLELFESWQERHLTRTQRFAGIVGRHSQNAVQWIDAFKIYPIGSFELNTVLTKLTEELRMLFDEAHEAAIDMQTDIDEEREIFLTFQKEIAKLPDDKNDIP